MWAKEKQYDKIAEFTIFIQFDFDHSIRYERESYEKVGLASSYEEWEVPIGNFYLNKANIESLSSIDEFWDLFNSNQIYSMMNDDGTIDIDADMQTLANCYGNDFVPDANIDWYALNNGCGKKGEDLIYPFQNWKKDQFNRKLFFEEYQLYKKYGNPICIIMHLWHSYSGYKDKDYYYEAEFDGKQVHWNLEEYFGPEMY